MSFETPDSISVSHGDRKFIQILNSKIKYAFAQLATPYKIFKIQLFDNVSIM